MAAFESSYKSLLLGVTQQVVRERLPGQVQSQENMLSDPVTNLRRRPGAQIVHSEVLAGADNDKITAWFTDVSDQMVHIWVDCNGGNVLILDQSYTLLTTLQNDYLKADSIKSIYGSAMGPDFYICNTEVLPQSGGSSGAGNDKRGFFTVRSGAFSADYTITLTVTTAGVSTSYSYTYTTPAGTASGDAAASAPAYIQNQLTAQINAQTGTTGVTAAGSGNSSYLTTTADTMAVVTSTSSTYMIASGKQYIQDAATLPPTMPTDADGLLVSTGSINLPVWYRWSAEDGAWLEDGAPGSPTSLTGMPIVLSFDEDDSTWHLDAPAYEGRLSGDDTTNELPAFLDNGITGMGSFQGRLVLLAGNMVCLSASNKPQRFFRSTITVVAADDPIGIGSSANSSAAYTYCVAFMKDLLLFSEKYQALIPSSNVAVTPETATVLVTSTYDADMTSAPVSLGRTLLFPAPRSSDYFGFKEMLPSTTVDSQYTSDDVTAHLPKYMAGRCYFSVSSTVANLALFCPTGERDALIVHEYLWTGDTKSQQAWHKWRFQFDVGSAYFAVDRTVLLFVRNGMIVACEIDPRAGNTDADNGRRPFMDFWQAGTVTDHELDIPAWVQTFCPDNKNDLRLAVYQNTLAGEPVGFQYNSDTDKIETVRSYPDGQVTIGFPYTSSFSPSPPMVQDQNGVMISSNKLTLLRFMISTNMSGEYSVMTQDSSFSDDSATASVGTLYWSSTELELGQPRLGADSTALVPCRTNANTTTMLVYTDGLSELNCVALEYVARYNQRLTRR